MKRLTLISGLLALGMIMILNIPIASASLSDGLVAYYPFNGNADDESGNGNNGTPHGEVSYVDGVIGNAASFDGINDYVRIAQSPTLNNLQTMTLTYWIKYYKPVSGPGDVGATIGNGSDSPDPFVDGFFAYGHKDGIYHMLGKWGDAVAVNVPIDATKPLPEQEFTFVTFLVSEDRIKSYRNGELAEENDRDDRNISRPLEDWFVGQSGSNNYYLNGQIDDLRIYNRVLSEEEIKVLCSQGSQEINVIYNISQNGVDLGTVIPIETPETGAQYYDYRSPDGYPDFGPEAKKSFVWLHRNTLTGDISMGLIHNTIGGGESTNRIHMVFTGLPDTASLVVKDDLNDTYSLTPPTAEYRWGFSEHSDGAVMEGFGGLWQVTLTPSNIQGISSWSFVSGTYGTGRIELDLSKTLEIRAVPQQPLMGDTLKIPQSYEFSLEKYTQTESLIQLTNPTNEYQSASLEVINPLSDLTVSLTHQNPITIAPGEVQDIPIVLDAGSMPVGVYDDLLLKLTVEDGETLYSNIKVSIVEQGTGDLPDLSIRSDDIQFTNYTLGESATLKAVIHNKGLLPASNVQVQFYEFGNLLGETVIEEVSAEGIGTTSITAPITTSGEHLIRVVIDSSEAIEELDETNNEASQIIKIGSPSPIPGNILVTGSLPSTVYTDHLFTISGRAVYDIYVDGTRYTNYVVKGGSVQITIKGDGGTEWVYGDVHTDINGNFSKVLQAPASPETYRIIMTVTDNTFIGKRELELSVTEPLPPSTPPPLPPTSSGIGIWTYSSDADTWNWTWTTPPVHEPTSESDLRVYSENIHFSTNNPAPDEEITVFAEILYWASSTALVAQDIPVHFYVTYPGSPMLKIGETMIDRISVGAPDFGSRYVYTTWKNRHEGVYIVEVEIDPNYVEENQLNNAATRAIIVGQIESFSGVISGQATDPWGGVGNVIIELYDSNGTTFLENKLTDDTGYYLFENVPVDEYQVHIIKPDGYQVDAQAKTAIVSDQSVSVVDFQLRKQNPPIADAGDNFTLLSEAQHSKVLYGWANDPDGDPLTYRWFEGDQVLKDWTNVGANGEARLDLSAVPDFLPGSHELTLEVSDGIYSPNPTDSMVLAINNSPPYVVASAGGTYQVCTEVQLNGSAGDYDGDSLQYRWFERITDELGSTVENTHCSGTVASIYGGEPVSIDTCSITACSLEMGEHTFVLEVTDSVNGAVQDETLVKVIDTSAPTLKPVPSTFILWPPNHKMVDVTIVANAVDNTGDPVVLSATVNSSEPPDASGDGATMPDFTEAVIDQTTGIISLQLRAERAGEGIGRTYTITITATDQSDNFSTANVSILAPHDISGAN